MTPTGTVLLARSFGGPEVLELHADAPPAPAAGEVLVEVRAAGIDPIDARRMTGEFGRDLPPDLRRMVNGVAEGTYRWQVSRSYPLSV